MKRNILLIVLFGTFLSYAKGQGMFAQDVSGRPLKTSLYSNVEGSPYFREDWLEGEVVLANGKSFKMKKMKFDLIGNQIVYQSDASESLALENDVKSFKLELSSNGDAVIFEKGYSDGKAITNKIFLQVLYHNKKVTLLRRDNKIINESREYNSTEIAKKILSVRNYYIQIGTQTEIVSVPKNKKDFLALFKEDGARIETVLKEKKLDFKKENDLIDILKEY